MLEGLKQGHKAVGVKQTLKALQGGNAKVVFLARDADEKVVAGIKESCAGSSVEVVYVDTMKLLGKACGIEVGAAAACILEAGTSKV